MGLPCSRLFLELTKLRELFSAKRTIRFVLAGRLCGRFGRTVLSLSRRRGRNFTTCKPILAKVLAVPALRAKYLGYVREIADKSFDWNVVGPIVKQYRELIADDVARDTRKLFSTEEFVRTTADDPTYGTLRSFFEGRRTFLLRWLTENNAAAAPR